MSRRTHCALKRHVDMTLFPSPQGPALSCSHCDITQVGLDCIGLVSNSRMPYSSGVMAVHNASVNIQAGARAAVHPRYMMELSPELLELLNRLASRTGGSEDIREVMQKAIALLDVAAQAKDKGQKIGILDQNDKLIQEIVGI
jgi:hypothetical protein